MLSLIHQSGFYQIPLTLGRLLSQNVAVKRVLALDFSGTRQLKTLFGTRIGFHFGHNTKISKSDKF